MFEVGDRIAVYDLYPDNKGNLRPRRVKAVVMQWLDGIVEFQLEGKPIYGQAHPKQCRKLKEDYGPAADGSMGIGW